MVLTSDAVAAVAGFPSSETFAVKFETFRVFAVALHLSIGLVLFNVCFDLLDFFVFGRNADLLLDNLLLRPREDVRVAGEDLDVLHLDQVEGVVGVVQETVLKLLFVGVVEESVNGMGPFLKKLFLAHFLPRRVPLLSNSRFSLVLDQSGDVRRVAVHVSKDGVGGHVAPVGDFLLSPGGIDDHLLVAHDLAENVLRREDALSELVSLEGVGPVVEGLSYGRLLTEILGERVHCFL